METANLTVEPITYSNAYELVNAFHYLGSKRFMGQYVFGLIQDLTVIGAVVYSRGSYGEPFDVTLSHCSYC